MMMRIVIFVDEFNADGKRVIQPNRLRCGEPPDVFLQSALVDGAKLLQKNDRGNSKPFSVPM
jgi:hypothetical protein